MNALNHFLSPAVLRAAGFTLLHSLWQGALVALAASVLLMLLHRHRAEVRYRVVAGALALVVGLAVLTFISYARPAPVAATTEVTAEDFAAQLQPATGAPAASASGLTGRVQALLAAGSGYVERHLPLVVGAWLLGMLAMTLRFLGGLAYVQRLRRYRVAALPAAWQARLDELAARAGLTQRVQLLASALVPSPVVVGYFKPVILIPLGAATGLDMRELEMILAHELAHVLRKDYLFNLLQSVAEIVFFYHPAVWFLSGSLRTERENCCDDVATELCGDSRLLAQALSSLAELTYAGRAPQLAMAATGPGGTGLLLNRVRRLVTHRPSAPTFLEGFWAACVVLASAGLLAGSTLASLDASAQTPVLAAQVAEPGLVPATVPVVPPVGNNLAPALAPVEQEKPQAAVLVPATVPVVPALAGDTLLVFTSPGQKTPDVYVTGRKVGRARLYKIAAGDARPAVAPKATARKRNEPLAATAPQAGLTTSAGAPVVSTAQGTNPHARIEAELRKDGLLRNPDRFDYTIKANSLVVDGQVQSPALAEKYARLYEAETGRKLGPTSSHRHTRNHQEDGSTATHAQSGPGSARAQGRSNGVIMPPPPPAAPAPAPDNAAITRQLKKDGLIAADAKSYQFELTKNGLVVNGQAQSEATAAPYRSLLNVPANQSGNSSSSVRLSVNE